MSISFQPHDTAIVHQVMTPMANVQKDWNKVVPEINHNMGTASTTVDTPTFEKKFYCDLPFHPLSLLDSRNKNDGGIMALQVQQKLEPLKMRSLQSNFIVNTMNDLRESERAAANKRRKTDNCFGDCHVALPAEHKNNYDDQLDIICDASLADVDEDVSIGCSFSSTQFNIQDELKTHPRAIHVVATAGGLITHCK